jgi:adenylate kinase
LEAEAALELKPAIILFGSPGSGKGTQAKLLGEVIAGPHISTGDMLRGHVAAGDGIGKEAQRLIKAGKLVPDEMVNILVRHRLLEPDCRAGMILDGYPRTVNQAKVLLELMEEDGFRPSVVHLVVDYEKIVARLSGRRQCPVCGTLYSLTTNPPKVAGICDRDGGTLVTREDDREAVIRERLHEYDVQTVPILNFFRESGVPLFEVDAGEASPDTVRQRVCSQLLEAGVIRTAAGRK